MKVDAERIIRERELQGLSQRGLAQVAGVAIGTMARLEHGYDTRPETAKKVSDALGLTVGDIRLESKRVPVAG